MGRSYTDTDGDCFWGQLGCKILTNLLKNSGFKSNISFFTINWVSFDQSTSNFAGGYVISRHKWGLILESIGLYNPCQLVKLKVLKYIIMHSSHQLPKIRSFKKYIIMQSSRENLVSWHCHVSCLSFMWL